MSTGGALAAEPRGTREPLRQAWAVVREPSGALAVQVAAFALSMVLLVLLLWALDYSPGVIIHALWSGSAGTTVSFGISVSEAVPLILTATAVWLAFQGGLFNIGADGQLQMGGLAALVVVSDVGLPHWSPLVIVLGLLAAGLAGAAWSGIAAVLRAYTGANEIISTLMLNYIAFISIDQIMRGPLQSQANAFTPQTDRIPDAAVIPSFVGGTQITWAIVIATVVAVAVIVHVRRSSVGLRLRAIGLNREAARRAGVPIDRFWLVSLTSGGFLAGIAGGLVILGLRYYIAPGWASPWGFQGILIAFLALSSPYLIPVWGLLFGMLAAAGPALKGDASVPDSIVTMMQTLPVVCLFALYAAGRWLRYGRTWGAVLRRPPQEAPTDA